MSHNAQQQVLGKVSLVRAPKALYVFVIVEAHYGALETIFPGVARGFPTLRKWDFLGTHVSLSVVLTPPVYSTDINVR